ncbi:MAG: hypothetical protein R3F60_30420 [bacterium]
MRTLSLLLILAALAAPGWSAPPPPLTENGLYADLAALPLDGAALASLDGLIETLAEDPGLVHLLTNLVECALPVGSQVEAGEQVFEGSFGLAGEWADGPCDETCQRWVSACILARTNAYGLPVRIYLDGPNPHLQTLVTPDRQGFTVREAAFFGNVFQTPARRFACRGDGDDPLALTWRVCGRPGSRCGSEVLGACGPVDGETGEAVPRPVCTLAPDGTYHDCREGPDGPVHAEVLTLFMRPTSFGGALQAGCGTPPPSTPAPRAPGAVGSPCLHSAACAEGLFCDVSYVGQGVCTRACGDAEVEDEAVCVEPGSTCLRAPIGAFCTRACGDGTPCGAGQMCSGLWLLLGQADDPGCFPFCTEDAHCGAGTHCNPRSGTCGFPAPTAGQPDGTPCDPSQEGVSPCRGLCFRVDDDPTHGLCVSLLNKAVQADCPDDPATMTPLRPDASDDLALCIFRECQTDDDCEAPLRCTRVPLRASRCDYP